MGKSSIEWLNGGSSWNPLKALDPITGKVGWHCIHIAPECLHCYADTFNRRKLPYGGTGLPYLKTSRAKTFVDADVLEEVFKIKAGEFVFPCSMTDVAGEFVDPRDTFTILKACSLAVDKRFLILTKRPDRLAWMLDPATTEVPALGGGMVKLRETAKELLDCDGPIIPGPHLWFGSSAGTQGTWNRSVPGLARLALQGHNVWLSAEPMLEDVAWLDYELCKIKWVVIGGESGVDARDCSLDAVRKSLRFWQRAGVPVYVKQLGRRPVGPWGSTRNIPVGKAERWHLRAAKGNDPAEWPVDIRVRQYPRTLEGVEP
jgi:protein gp37